MTCAKNRMLTVLLLLAILTIALTINAQAQPMRMSIEERVKILKDSLNLTNEQTVKVKKVLEKQREEMVSLREENRSKREANRKVIKESIEKTDKEIIAILNEKQAKKYDEMMKQRRERMEKRLKDIDK